MTPATMTRPRTGAGRRLLTEYRAWFRLNGFGDEGWDPDKSAAALAVDICAIEEEAQALPYDPDPTGPDQHTEGAQE